MAGALGLYADEAYLSVSLCFSCDIVHYIFKVVDMWKQRDVQLEVPQSPVDVDKYAKPIEPLDTKMINNNVPVSC